MPQQYKNKGGRRRRKMVKANGYPIKDKRAQRLMAGFGGAAKLAGALAPTLPLLLGLNTETKAINNSSSVTVNDTTGQVLHMTAIAEGTASNQRSGRFIRSRYITSRLHLKMHASATQTLVRVVIIISSDENAPTTSSFFTSQNALSTINLLYSDRYRIIYDNLVNLDTYNPTAALNIFRKPRQRIKFNGTASTDYENGQMWMLLLSNEATNTPTVAYYNRFSYNDN